MGGLHFRKTKEAVVEETLLGHYDQYYRLAYSYVKNAADADDIVQNGAYRAIRNSKSLKQEEYAATWLYRIMLNEIFTFCRKRKVEAFDCVSTDALEYTPTEASSEDRYEDVDLRRALAALSKEERTVVELKYFEDLKLEEIAAVLEENVNSVKSRLYRSIRKLRLKLETE